MNSPKIGRRPAYEAARMTPDLTREDAFAWMARTGNGALRAARHFAGENASDSDVKLIHNRIKQWKRRAKSGDPAAVVHHPQIAASGHPLPEIPDVDPATESRVDFYSRRLRDVETWIRLAATTGRSTLLASMLRQQSEDRKELDEAIEEAARERAHAERAKVRDPEQIAASILDALPALLGVCTDATRARFIDAIKQTSWMEPEQIDVDSDEE